MKPKSPLMHAVPSAPEAAQAWHAVATANRLSREEVDRLVGLLTSNAFEIERADLSYTNAGSWIVWASRAGTPCAVWYEGRDAALWFRVGQDESHVMSTTNARMGPDEILQALLAALGQTG